MTKIEYDFGGQLVSCTAGPGEDGKWRGHVRVTDSHGANTDTFSGEAPGAYWNEQDAVIAAAEWARTMYPAST